MKPLLFLTFFSLTIFFQTLLKAQAPPCDTTFWVGSVSAGGGAPPSAWMDAQQMFQGGIITIGPSASFPTPYYTNLHYKDTFCITNNFSFEIRLKNDTLTGGSAPGDTYISLIGSGIAAGCLLEGTPAGQPYTSIYAGASGATGIPQLVMNLSTWRTIRFDFTNNVVYFSYDGANFYNLNYSGNICNIEGFNIGFRGSGQVDWIKIYDAYNTVIYQEDFNSCAAMTMAPPCPSPVANAAAQNAFICEGDSINLIGSSNMTMTYGWQGPNGFTSTAQNPSIPAATPAAAGWYKITGTVNYCIPVSADSVYITVHPKQLTNVNAAVCQGDSYLAGGSLQTTAGIYYDTLSTVYGCDSVVATNLSILPLSNSNPSVFICLGQSYFVGGASQTQAGIYYDTLANVNGCDSIIATNLNIISPVYTNLNPAICQGQSYFAGGMLQTQAGIYYDTLMAASSCDSIIITNLQIIPILVTNQNISICQGQTFPVGGGLQSQAGIYTDTLQAVTGCDSIVITNLQVIAPVYYNQNLSICQGSSIFLGGQNQTQAGTYYDTIASAAGCDSIIISTLSLIAPVYTNTNALLCQGDSIFVGGSYQTQAGNYNDTLQTSVGCDSIITTNVQLVLPVYNNLSASICQGDSYYAGGNMQTQSGTYYDTLQSIQGCDSIVITQLTVIAPSYGNRQVSICDGQSFFTGGSNQFLPGNYIDTLVAASGCDSILTTQLVVNPNPVIYLGTDTSICEQSSLTLDAGAGYQSYSWQNGSSGEFYNASQVGYYWVKVTDQNGCIGSDTLQIVQLFPLPQNFLPADTVSCGLLSKLVEVPGYADYVWSNGSTDASLLITATGSYSLQVTDYNGCMGNDDLNIENICSEPLLFPNAFTPNGDGLNDIFQPVMVDNVNGYNLKVFDRWGKMIYEGNNPQSGWDGTDQGVRLPIGSYVYSARYFNDAG